MSIQWRARLSIPWVETPPVHPPLRDFLTKIVIKRGRRIEERGDLFFFPNQTCVPIVVMDSMGQRFERPDRAIFLIWHGATLENLCTWIREQLPAIESRVPLPPRIVLMGGGNSLSSRYLPSNPSSDRIADRAIDEIYSMFLWCKDHNTSITISSILPRPADHDKKKSQLSSNDRTTLCRAYVRVNDYIEELNEAHNLPQLPLHRMVSVCGKNRYYPRTRMERIRLSCFFEEDWVHLSDKGTKNVSRALTKYLEKC